MVTGGLELDADTGFFDSVLRLVQEDEGEPGLVDRDFLGDEDELETGVKGLSAGNKQKQGNRQDQEGERPEYQTRSRKFSRRFHRQSSAFHFQERP